MSIPTDTVLSRQMRKAVSALQRGEPRTAERYFAQILESRPDFADGWHFRAVAAHQMGNSKQASEWLDMADQLAPGRPDFSLNRARFLLECKDFEKAAKAANFAMADPVHAEDAVMIHAQAQLALGHRDDALVALRTFITSHAKSTKATLLVVTILKDYGRDEEIEAVYTNALAKHPDNHELSLWYAAFLQDNGRYKEAESLSSQLTSNPEVAPLALTQLALSSLQRGDHIQAESYSASALQQDASLGTAWMVWIDTGPPERNFPAPFPSVGDSTLAFAKARLLDRRHDYANAWAQYNIAHEAARKETGPYDREGQVSYVDDILGYLTKDFIEQARHHNEKQAVPIFVCGISRSGTTLLEQLLASHPTKAVRAGGEMRTVHQLLRRYIGPESLGQTGSRLASMEPDAFGDILSEWNRAIIEAAGTARYVTDKMPSNAFLLGLIQVAYPESPIVLLERDPLAIACSCFVTPFSEGHFFTHQLSDMAHFFAQYRRTVKHWSQIFPQERILHLRFEDLVTNPRITLHPLLEKLQLDWDNQMLSFHERREPVATASLLQVRKPLDPSAIDSWKRFRDQIEPWRQTLEDAYYNGNLDLKD